MLILQDSRESRHPLNTARLAALGLARATLLAGTDFDPALWAAPGAMLLFPGPDARVLAPAGPVPAPTLLVVPDGTWRHARGLLARHPTLAALPRLTLPEGLPALYRVRRAQDAGALSTVEAIAHALDALEAPKRFDALLAPFEALVQGQIAAMGPAIYARDHLGPRQD